MKCFLPDETRSGRFRGISQPASGDLPDARLDASGEPVGDLPSFLDGSVPTTTHRPMLERPAPVTAGVDVVEIASSEDGTIKCEQSDSADETDALTTSSSEDEAGASHTGAARPMKLPTVPDRLKLVQHVKYRTALDGSPELQDHALRTHRDRRSIRNGHFSSIWKHKADYES